MEKDLSNTMIIFGGTGDLTHRKLIPALYQLYIKCYLPDDFSLLCIGRRDKTTEEYVAELRESVKKYTSRTFKDELFDELAAKIRYFHLNFDAPEDYERLRDELTAREEKGFSRNYLFYLAVSPEYFSPIVENLKASGIRDNPSGWERLVIEKPFGKDLESATALNDNIRKVFEEKDIYRIDHYVAKEMIQNITMLRFQNTIFESLWNNKYIDNIQINVLEKEGVGTRGGYYDHTGALRDMVQNHLLQLLAITAMEPPVSLEADDVRNEKVRVFESVRDYGGMDLADNVIFGQYEGYHDEDKVAKDSQTETLVAAKIFIDNERWSGVPFYLVTGKALKNKTAQVTVEFKRMNPYGDAFIKEPNILEIKIQPDEGITFHLNVKKPGVIDEMVTAEMDYCQSCMYLYDSPDSYEKLLLDAMIGDSTRFTRWDELLLTWKFIDSILGRFNGTKKHLETYAVSSDGPESLDSFIDSGSKKWWYLNRDYQWSPGFISPLDENIATGFNIRQVP